MNKIGKFFANILIVAYAVIAIAVTILLLSYNDYHCSVIGGYTFILVTDDELEEHGYEEGSLILVKETKAKNIKPGDDIFLYRKISSSQFEIKYAEVLLKDESKGEYDVSYVLEGSTVIDHDDVIGSTEGMVVVPHLGTILSILQSRYGYLFLIVVVSFIAFLYEIYELIMEIKYGEREEDEDDYEEEYDDDYDDEEYDEEDYDEEDYDDEEYEEEEEEIVKPKKRTTTTKKATSGAKKMATTKKTSTQSKTTTAKRTSSASKSTTAKRTTSASKTTGAKKTATTKKASTTPKATTAKKTSTTPKATTVKKTSTQTKTTTTRKKSTQEK